MGLWSTHIWGTRSTPKWVLGVLTNGVLGVLTLGIKCSIGPHLGDRLDVRLGAAVVDQHDLHRVSRLR
jgi:hypothetical protein